jgi:phosphopantetheinyl transferase
MAGQPVIPFSSLDPAAAVPTVHVGLVRLVRPLRDSILERVVAALGDDARARLDGSMRREDVERIAISDVLARTLLARQAGAAPRDIALIRNAWGPAGMANPAATADAVPAGMAGVPWRHVSTAGDRRWVACAVSRLPVGVVVGKRTRPTALLTGMLPSATVRAAERWSDRDRSYRTARLWTAIEAYRIALGPGVRVPAASIHVSQSGEQLVARGPQGYPMAAVHVLELEPAGLLGVCGSAVGRRGLRVDRTTVSRLVASYLWDDVLVAWDDPETGHRGPQARPAPGSTGAGEP